MTEEKIKLGQYIIEEEPYYLPTGKEKEIFKAAFESKMPFAAIGPTGCGKTRFIQHMSYQLNQEEFKKDPKPFFFMTCHEDLTATDLLGRDRITGEYLPGILQRWAETGGILYLDEVVEARPDLATLIHPIMEPGRRIFYNERTGKVVELNPDCMLTMSWNPGYQDITKRLKVSTRQRLVTHRFDYPEVEVESQIIAKESGADEKTAKALAGLGKRIRGIKEGGYNTLREGASTRLLIYAGTLIDKGIDPRSACEDAVINCLTEGVDETYSKLNETIEELVENFFKK
ncbi:CbbQ/NirQ/NorQ/GpvN family protein [Candidatus Woesearchaeota archaeon]|nr:CbbQ/NirQ/NorQ/GpvN family protein [Candidatus Woesearchaeota archaeon]